MAASGFTQEGWLDFASQVGQNWLPGTTPVPLAYPAQLGIVSGPGALTADQSTDIGQQLLHAAILKELQGGEPVVVAALSQGTLVVERELRYLQSAPDAPLPGDVTFYLFGGMVRGVGDMYLRGVTIPFIGQTFGPVPESQYNVVVVNEQWDGWANPPDRPWNLLAVANAVMGAVYTVNGTNDHSQTALDSVSQAILVSRVTNSLGGVTTTYLVPRDELPVTRPLRQLGVPGWMVAEIDKALMPIVAAGYSSMTPNLGPRIQHGRLVFTPPPPPVIEPEPTLPESGDRAGAAPEAAEIAGGTAVSEPGGAPIAPAARTTRTATKTHSADAGSATEAESAPEADAAEGKVKRDSGVQRRLRLHRDRSDDAVGSVTRDRSDRRSARAGNTGASGNNSEGTRVDTPVTAGS